MAIPPPPPKPSTPNHKLFQLLQQEKASNGDTLYRAVAVNGMNGGFGIDKATGERYITVEQFHTAVGGGYSCASMSVCKKHEHSPWEIYQDTTVLKGGIIPGGPKVIPPRNNIIAFAVSAVTRVTGISVHFVVTRVQRATLKVKNNPSLKDTFDLAHTVILHRSAQDLNFDQKRMIISKINAHGWREVVPPKGF